MLSKHMPYLLIAAILALSGCATSHDGQTKNSKKEFADVHIHYNWDHEETLTVKTAVQRLKQAGVKLAVVSSIPTHYARKLSAAGEGWIVPLFSPYISAESRRSWFTNKEVLNQASSALANGLYQGIGELHLWDGAKPTLDNPILVGLLRLAQQYDVPFLIHTESASHLYFQRLCKKYPQVRFLWAHAGGKIKPASLAKLMRTCSNVWIETSTRDPWRYDSLTHSGLLPEEWVKLITEFPNRVMTGSDPVWNVTRTQRWDEADAGWDHLEPLVNYHRQWINQLPKSLQENVRFKNAAALFRLNK